MTPRRTVLGVGAALAVGLIAVAWSLLPKPGPAADARVGVWHVVPAVVEPLSGDPASCTAEDGLHLQKLRRVGTLEGPGLPATCKYEMHLQGWPEGEDECILEFASDAIRGIEAETLAAQLAATYYQRRQGGIMTFAGPTAGRAFISLDARWCGWSSVVQGLHAVP